MLRNKDEDRPERANIVLVVCEDARFQWRPAAEHGCTRRIAKRRRAKGMCKEHAPSGEAFYVRPLGLRMPTETADPVVQVIDCNKKNIGRGRGAGTNRRT